MLSSEWCNYVSSSSLTTSSSDPSLAAAAMLDLNKPGGGGRMTSCKERRGKHVTGCTWKLIGISRQGDVMLCVVRWVYPYDSHKPFSYGGKALPSAQFAGRTLH